MSRFFFLFLFVGIAIAQTSPSFEVATIRPTAGPIPGVPPMLGNQVTTADTLTIRHTPLIEIIRRAFSLSPQELTGGPAWIGEERYDVVGKSAAPATDAQLWAMARPLLEQRFKFKYHREPRQVSGLALVVAKNGPKGLTRSEGGSSNFAMGGGVFTGHNVPIARIATLLSALMRTAVLDATGLEGTYDFKIDPKEYEGSPVPTVIQEGLGLKLESRKFELQVMVIDRIEMPDEN